jgi:hypothetical protein
VGVPPMVMELGVVELVVNPLGNAPAEMERLYGASPPDTVQVVE